MVISQPLTFFIELTKAKTVVARRFDNRLSFHGLGFTDFIILYHLNEALHGKLRRIDLAEKVGLTASAVTRLLLPMEKIGLVSREANKNDARISYVVLAPGGKRLLQESLEEAESLASDLLPEGAAKKEMIELLVNLGKTKVY